MAATKLLALATAVRMLGAVPAENPLAPIAKEQARSTHGPFEAGDCFTCHDPKDQVAPGRLLKGQPGLCFDCHDEFRARVRNHPEPSRTCTRCHSPHNSKKRKLLL